MTLTLGENGPNGHLSKDPLTRYDAERETIATTNRRLVSNGALTLFFFFGLLGASSSSPDDDDEDNDDDDIWWEALENTCDDTTDDRFSFPDLSVEGGGKFTLLNYQDIRYGN